MDYDQVSAPPRAFVSGPLKIRIAEKGPARVAIEVTRETEGSKYVQTTSLSAGDAGNRVEFSYAIDWRTTKANLKQTFPLAVANSNATYSWDIGTVERSNEFDRQFEVASHRWIDLTDKSGNNGVTILTDCKSGSDKPSDNTIRVTLIRTPGTDNAHTYPDQGNQDWGHHAFMLGLAGHSGDWRQLQTVWQGYRLNNPLAAFVSTKHAGPLGTTFSFVHLNNPNIRVLALKKAEDSDEIVLRMVELSGAPARDVQVSFIAPIASVREIDAQEQPIGPAQLDSGALVTSFAAYQPRTFALHLGSAASHLAPPHSEPVSLQYDLATATGDDEKSGGGGFDGKGDAIPAELLPSHLDFRGIRFDLRSARTGVPNAMIAKGQTLTLPAGRHNRLYILAASAEGDQSAKFRVDKQSATLSIQSWTGWIGQWDNRLWRNQDDRDWAISANHALWPPPDLEQREARPRVLSFPEDYVGIQPGYVKPGEIAWYASHHHTADGLNEPYQYSYLFAYSIDLPAGSRTLTLPANDRIRILAATSADDYPTLTPASFSSADMRAAGQSVPTAQASLAHR
jgi:alpha-mannosidase